MKTSVILLVLCSSVLYAQEIILVDSVTGIAVENVNVFNEKTGISSNKNGVINIWMFNKNDTVKIQHISYYKKKIPITEIKNKILLSPKTTILPVINFNNEPKILTVFAGNILNSSIPMKKLSSKSTSNLMEETGYITVQESQSGGGSPNFRGMEANRLLLIVDGLALNNTISRSGHLQNSSTINPFFLESFSILTGPASIAFGDGAMGSALIFNTISPKFNQLISEKHIHQKYETSSNASTLNYKSIYSKKNIAFVSAFSVKSVGDLNMGTKRTHNYYDWGNESTCTLGKKQLYTKYSQHDFLQKMSFKLNESTYLSLNSQYYSSSNINRFDKLNDVIDGKKKYSEWYYGPQIRFVQSMKIQNNSINLLYENITAEIAFQDISESRHHRKYNNSLLSNRFENLKIYDANIDLKKYFFKTELSYGFGFRKQILNSTANKESAMKIFFENTTRYPNGGSDVEDLFLYSQLGIPFSKKIKLYLGGRGDYNSISADFLDNATYSFPFNQIKNQNTSMVSSALVNYNISPNISINTALYSGFRNPNIDDLGKVFSKDDKHVIVPNLNLEPEKSQNFELGFLCNFYKKMQLNILCFNTKITNAIQRENAALNGDTMFLYDGDSLRIQMNKNIASAKINGVNFFFSYNQLNHLFITINCNLIKGINMDKEPLAHIPPFNAKISCKYIFNTSSLEFYTKYNGWKHNEDYDLAGVDNLEEATINGTPPWYTLNLSYTKEIDKNLIFILSVENILDVHYKTFGSGLSASGRNFTLSLHSKF